MDGYNIKEKEFTHEFQCNGAMVLLVVNRRFASPIPKIGFKGLCSVGLHYLTEKGTKAFKSQFFTPDISISELEEMARNYVPKQPQQLSLF